MPSKSTFWGKMGSKRNQRARNDVVRSIEPPDVITHDNFGDDQFGG